MQPDGVNEIRGWRFGILWVVGRAMRLWCRSLRMDVDPELAAAFAGRDGGTVIAFWHNHLFVAAELHRRYRRRFRVGGMVSGSKDGAWLAAFFRTVGIVSVRGSQGKRSLGGTREAIRRVAEGLDLAVTPDGSRGPRHRAKPGAVFIANGAAVPLCVLGLAYTRSRQLRSWDRFNLPLPFSRVVVTGRFLTRPESIGELRVEDLQSGLDQAEARALTRLRTGRFAPD